MRALIAFILFVCASAPALAQSPAPAQQAEVRSLLDRWYAMHAADKNEVVTSRLMAPGGINAGPAPTVVDLRPQSAVFRGYRVNNELAARALQFRYDIDDLVIDGRFAKVRVWERGYFYAHAAQRTYENAASALFVLERQSDGPDAGQWLILAHEAETTGIPPTKITDPLPDLRDLYYSGPGHDRDPAADAEAAARN
jgi:hypothetical protein